MDAKKIFGQMGEELQQQQSQTSQEGLDSQIDKNIQKREIEKLQKVFYDNLQDHYSSRKYKEMVTLGCA